MKILVVGCDLDETLINNSYKHQKYTIKDKVRHWLPFLHQNGVRFHLISARNSLETVERVAHDLEYCFGSKFESIHATSFQSKAKLAQSLGCKYMIDDNVEYLKDCLDNQILPILLTSKVYKFKRVYPKWLVCTNWIDISVELLKEIKC